MTDLTVTPHNRQAEEAVIGAVLINPDVYVELSEFLQAEDFYIHRLRFIWQAFARLHERRIPIDFLTVSETLSQLGQLEEIGGEATLTGLLNATPTTLHAEAHGQIVRESAIRRQILLAANKIANLAHNQTIDLPETTEQAVAALEGAVLRESGGALVSIGEATSQAYDQIDHLSRTTELPGTPSGLPDLDAKLGNFQPGALYIVAARPGIGKTSLALTIALNAARAGKGRKQRVVPINTEARRLLDEWFTVRPDTGSEMLFIGQRGEPMQVRSIQLAVARIAASAGLDEVTPHHLRHTFAKSLLNNGVSLEKVAALLGHESLDTTRLYVTPGERDLEDAVAGLVG